MKIKNLAVLLDNKEKIRFLDKVIQIEKKDCIYFENLKINELFKLSKASIENVFILGARPTDIAAINFFSNYVKNIFILQHAAKAIRKEHNLGYWISNTKKIIKWLIFIITLYLIDKLYSREKTLTTLHILGFNENLFSDLKKNNKFKVLKTNEIFLSNPCYRWGTLNEPEINLNSCEYFMVDEPFKQTLGISEKEEQKILKNLLILLNPEKILVKIHPRSNKEKYAFDSRFKIVEDIYKNCDKLIGYESGLLEFNFSCKEIVKLSPPNWTISTYKNNKVNGKNYIIEAQEYIKEYV